MKKLPEVTLLFWIMKIAATTLGETAGDLLAQTSGVGYATSSVILLSLFAVSLGLQLKARKFHPLLYWTVILSTSTAGTTVSDFMNRTAGLGYARGALVLMLALAAIFVAWHRSGYPFDVARITTLRGETLYWAAILVSNTLGTSLGDFLADSSGLGFLGGALLVGGLIAIIILAMGMTSISRPLLFWTAFVLTRPLGATMGDFLTKPIATGGLGFGTTVSSLILGAILAALMVYSFQESKRTPSVAT